MRPFPALRLLPVVLIAACFSPPQTQIRAVLDGNYVLDSAHTSLVWQVSHVGLSQYTGRFDKISGTLFFDAVNPENSKVDVKIDPASFSTVNPDFDKKIIAAPGWLGAEKWPEIRFVSTEIDKIDATHGILKGDLTLRGQTHPVILAVTYNGAGKSFSHKGATLGFHATGSLNRSDFGLTKYLRFGIGDQVSFEIEAEFNEKP